MPIKPEVSYGCEMLGLDPLQLVNEGKMLLIVGEEETTDVLSALHENDSGKDAAIIGEISQPYNQNGKLVFKYPDGKKKIVARPKGVNLTPIVLIP